MYQLCETKDFDKLSQNLKSTAPIFSGTLIVDASLAEVSVASLADFADTVESEGVEEKEAFLEKLLLRPR
ncbi:hypothetical protein ACJJI3_06315 [Microbulbifer sp. ZKSA004]|uniref:hypothetical protein n=1 Tax=Microbulbifer sp. ZKSA004 TaxID=3243389 RepID=UPI00403A3E89